MKRTLCLTTLAVFMALGCNVVPSSMDDTTDEPLSATDTMREACPLLTDEVINGFILAIDGLRDDGLSEEEALALWVASCDNIPADGNFQGDIEACAACLTVIVPEVYAAGT